MDEDLYLHGIDSTETGNITRIDQQCGRIQNTHDKNSCSYITFSVQAVNPSFIAGRTSTHVHLVKQVRSHCLIACPMTSLSRP